MKDFIAYTEKKLLKVLLHIFWIFPVENGKITLLNELSYTYGDSMKYFDIYLHKKRKGKYKIVFPIKKGSTRPKYRDDIVVSPMTVKYFKEVITSEVIVTNAGGVSYLPKRKGQKILSTWHGGGPYKKTSTDVYNSFWYRLQAKMNSDNTDYILSSCKYCTDYELKSMGYSQSEIIPAGMPRNDVIFAKHKNIKEKVRKYYSVPDNVKFVLFAPTFRTSNNEFSDASIAEDYIELDIDMVKKALEKKFNCEWLFGIRLHPKLDGVDMSYMSVINCTSYPDMQELLCAADVVISDYSSLIWDYSFSYRPVFLYAPDIEQYEEKRGFYMPSSKWPFPIAHNNDEMKNNILTFDNDSYVKHVKEHHEESGSYETGHSCEKLLELIET